MWEEVELGEVGSVPVDSEGVGSGTYVENELIGGRVILLEEEEDGLTS